MSGTCSLTRRLPAIFLAAALGPGCDCGSGVSGDGDVESGADAALEADVRVEDAGEEADAPPDVADETTGAEDAAVEDSEDLDADAEEEGASEPDCTMPDVIPEDPVDPTVTKFALQMMHFNIQYVAGGLAGFCPVFCDYDERATEDLIIRESFVPVLDFYLDHPTWGVDIELPSYMIEVLAERWPDELAKLQTLTQRGQVSLISFHFSAQLFLAFPIYDQQKSWELTRDIFEEYCLPRSPTVFNQEGEFGEGRHEFMREHGYTIGVFPKNP